MRRMVMDILNKARLNGAVFIAVSAFFHHNIMSREISLLFSMGKDCFR
jgi:hypothetical protein